MQTTDNDLTVDDFRELLAVGPAVTYTANATPPLMGRRLLVKM